ncbi:MAG: hypothetical protein ACYC19_02185 [Acidimicrobiales bacterium]
MLDVRKALRDMRSNVVFNTPRYHYIIWLIMLFDNKYLLRDSPTFPRPPTLEGTLLEDGVQRGVDDKKRIVARRKQVVNHADALQRARYDSVNLVGADMTRRTCRYREDRDAGVCWQRLRDNQRNRVSLNIEHFSHLRAHLTLNEAGQRICSEGIDNLDMKQTVALSITKENP